MTVTAKQYLKRYIDEARRVQAVQEQIYRLRCEAEKTTTAFSDAPGSSEPADKTGRLVVSMVDLQSRAEDAAKRLAEIRAEVERAIDAVPDKTLRDLLTCRYILDMRWEDVARTIDRAVDMTRIKLHAKALDAVQGYLNRNI